MYSHETQIICFHNLCVQEIEFDNQTNNFCYLK